MVSLRALVGLALMESVAFGLRTSLSIMHNLRDQACSAARSQPPSFPSVSDRKTLTSHSDERPGPSC